MIIHAIQTNSNFKNEFEIYYDKSLKYRGRHSVLSSKRANLLFDLEGATILKTEYSRALIIKEAIGLTIFLICGYLLLSIDEDIMSFPLKMLTMLFIAVIASFFPRKQTDVCRVLDASDNTIATFMFFMEGALTAYNSIEFNDKIYKIYSLSKSHYNYRSIYLDNTQIGQITKDLHVKDNKNNYVLYLLDEQKLAADLLSMFIIYLDNIYYAAHGEVSYGVSKTWSYSYNKTNKYYDPNWVRTHFNIAKSPGESAI